MQKNRTKSNLPYYTAMLALGLGSHAFGAPNTWDNQAADQDWNNPINWSDPDDPSTGADHVPTNAHTDEDALINIDAAGEFPILSAPASANPRDIRVGVGTEGPLSGRLDINGAGSVNTSGWSFVGTDAGNTGILNYSSSGDFETGQLHIGRTGAAGSIHLNGSGTFTARENIELTNSGGVASTIQGGTVQGNRELFVGNAFENTGLLDMSGGTVSTNNWAAIGRDSSTGIFNISGGTLNVSAGDPGQWFAIGSDLGDIDNPGDGTVNHSAGTVNTPGTRLGENGASIGRYTLSGTGELNSGETRVGWNGDTTGEFTVDGGTANITGNGVIIGFEGNASGTVSLNGGTVNTTAIIGGGSSGTKQLNLNGGIVKASADNTDFISDVPVDIQAGGATIDSNGFDIEASSDFSGVGGITKNGAGTLSLLGDNDYTGDHTINEGVLILGTGFATGTGDITVADGAGTGVATAIPDEQILSDNVSFLGTATTFTANFGDVGGLNPVDPPLDVSDGNLVVNGTVSVTVIGTNFEVAPVALLAYDNTTRSGGGTFILSGIPLGVTATLVDDTAQGLLYLDVTSVAQTEWDGTVDGVWDTSTVNWFDQVTDDATTYSDGDPVTFGDGAGGTTDLVLDQTVLPSLVQIANSTNVYTLTGAGKISGTTNLIKSGTESLTITGILNDYTGVTRINEGTVAIDTLTNGNTASSIGAASPAPENIVLEGGTLNYTGAATTTDRGFTGGGGGTLDLDSDLTVSGTLAATQGAVIKDGAGSLILTNPGTNALSGGTFQVVNGLLALEGSGTQVNTAGNELWVGSNPDVPALLNMDGARLEISTWLSVGRGNGDTETVSSLTMTNGSIINSRDFSTGFDAGRPNDATSNLTLTDSTINTGRANIAESAGSTCNITLVGASDLAATDRTLIGMASDTFGTITVGGSSSFTTTQYMSIGQNGSGEATVMDTGTLSAANDLNLGDLENSTGTLTIQDSAQASGGTTYVGKGLNSVGILNLDGGTLTTRRLTGQDGDSTVEFNGGVLRAATDANEAFMDGLTLADIQSGGATIDTNGNDVTVSQDMSGTGALTKAGAGILTLDGFSSYSGNTTVSAGVLSMINPTLANGAMLSIATGAVIDLPHGLVDNVIALSVGGGAPLPDGDYTADTAATDGFISGTGTIRVGAVVQTPYEAWIDGFFPDSLDPDVVGMDADPDGDGQANKVEFALGGLPNDGGNNAKIYTLTTDRLLLTIAVRIGTPPFGAGPTPTATFDGCTYTVEGTDDLTAFNSAVSVAALETTGLPMAPDGYEYRTFSLDSSVGFPSKGFMRADITP